MQRRLSIFGLFILLLYLLYGLYYGCWQPAAPLAFPPAATPRARLLLVPLDSRPPCRDFVRDAAALVDYEIILPPSGLMDYYSAPGETQKMQAWLADNLPQAEVAIISLDQLLSGGLLASREGHATQEKADKLINYLRRLHQQNPDVRLQAFSILPRLLPPDSIDSAQERKALLRYSRLLDKADLGDVTAEELQEINELRAEISAKSLTHYEKLFKLHYSLCAELTDLVREGILDRLIIGRDDSGLYGLPNLEARQLERLILQTELPAERVLITHGADELALTMLAAYAAKAAGISPRIRLAYNAADTPERLMPYMGGSLRLTAEEKLALTGGQKVLQSEKADFTLFISAVWRDNLDTRLPSALSVRQALRSGESIALVDLSEHFTAEETVLPQLLRIRAPLQQLTAYAGWNTASNAIGTAVAHAVLAHVGQSLAADTESRQRISCARLTLLNQRLLEDSFYLKDVIDKVNYSLRRAGYNDVNDLDMDRNYHWANAMLQGSLAERRSRLILAPAFRLPYHDKASGEKIFIRKLREEAFFPWPRTFEINLRAEPQFFLCK